MAWLQETLRRLRWSLRREDREAELAEEIRFHLEESARQRAAEGVSAGEAASIARRRLGNSTLIGESSRDAWRFAGLESVLRDLGYALRQLRRSPAFAAATTLALALGIGAVTTVFSVVDAVILRELPVREPRRLATFANPGFSAPIFMEVNRRANSFEGFFAWSNERLTVNWGERTEGVPGLLALGPYHETLGVEALLGRALTSEDDFGRNGRAAVLSHACWQTRFGGDREVLGKTIGIDGAAYTIVGVMPAGFFGVAPGFDPEVTISAASLPMRHPGNSDRLTSPTQAWLHLMARLKPGVSLEQANAELSVYWPQVMEAVTPADMAPERRQRYLGRKTELLSGATGFSGVRRQFEESLWLLFGLVGLLFAVSCASAANLMLARMRKRRRELAVRTAIGAGRVRILRQILTEGLLIAALGAAGGVAVASVAARAVVRLLSTSESPIQLYLAPDGRVMAFCLGAALLATLVCALIPALRSTSADPHEALKEARAAGEGRGGLSAAVVAGQVALSVALLCGCGLFLRSLDHVLSLDAGFDREPLIVASLDPVAAGYEGSRMSSWYDRIVESVAALPNVESASLSWIPPISNEMGSWTQYTAIDGKDPQEVESATTFFNVVSEDYFATVGTRLLEGRTFTALDAGSAAAVVIINAPLARAYFPNGDAIGRRITIGRAEERRDLEIVGIVESARYQYLQEPARRIAYMPLAQHQEMIEGSNLTLEARSRGAAMPAVAAVGAAIRAADSAVPFRIETMDDRIAESLVREIALAKLASVLGVLSLILATAGLYGLLVYSVARRTNEIGVRMAMGATRTNVVRMVLRDAGRLTAAGLLAGVALFVAAARLAAGLIHGVSPTDVGAIAAASLLVFVIALTAAFAPARQASRVNPVDAMRCD